MDDALIRSAADRLRQGRLVAFPTETVYGLGADALDARAVERVFEVKGRPARNPLIVHVDGVAMARRLARSWPERAERLAGAFWPGPLTVVVDRSELVPGIVTGGGVGVGLRCPDHPVALALIGALGGPIVGPSANRSGLVSPTTAAHVRAEFPGEDVLVLDGGACRVGVESTVVAVEGARARVLRAGAVGVEDLERVLGEPVEAGVADGRAEGREDGPLESPGMLGAHYAPRTPAVRFARGDWDRVRARATGRVVVLTWSGLDPGPGHGVIAMPTDGAGYAARLYAALREGDAARASLLAIEEPPAVAGGSAGERALWRAVRDRLARASRRVG